MTTPRPPRAAGALVLAHHHPGRLRLRSESFCDVPPGGEPAEVVARVQAALTREKGVRAVDLRRRSGSVLVTYEPGIADPNVLIDIVSQVSALGPPITEDELRARRSDRRLTDGLVALARGFDALTRELTGGRADLRDALPVVMTGAAALSFLAKKDRMPHWANLAFWAFSVFQTTHRPGPRPGASEEHEPGERRAVRARGRPS